MQIQPDFFRRVLEKENSGISLQIDLIWHAIPTVKVTITRGFYIWIHAHFRHKQFSLLVLCNWKDRIKNWTIRVANMLSLTCISSFADSVQNFLEMMLGLGNNLLADPHRFFSQSRSLPDKFAQHDVIFNPTAPCYGNLL